MIRTHTVHELAYRSARSLYLRLKQMFGPAIRSHPRLHRVAAAFKERVKRLIRTPDAVYELPNRPGAEGCPGGEPDLRGTPESGSELPAWLIDEWRNIHVIEPQLFPDPDIQSNVVTDFISPSKVGEYYLSLCELYGEGTSHVFLVPWLKKGGADLVTINYVRSLIENRLGTGVAVIATEDADSPWASKLPAEARFIEFGRRYSGLAPEEQEKLLARVLLQMAPQVVHNINSHLGYDVFIKYGMALREGSHLYACAFCEDITAEGRSIGYPVCFLPRCFDSLTAVLSDNRHILDKLRNLFAFEEEKLFTHYQPMSVESVGQKVRRHVHKDSLDILWASRLDIQKRPDILIRIAERCKDLPFTFHVYGSPVYGTTEQQVRRFIRSLNALPNVRYYGDFDGLPSLPTERYDLFLYTSQWDGLPNVLLEAVALGLPVVASATGGIPELIEEAATGFLVSPFDNIEGYVHALEQSHNDRAALSSMANNALALLRSRHSWHNFTNVMRDIPFYWGRGND